jgi:sulfide:quinone oxidoreductase
VAARCLRKLLPSPHRIVLVDRETQHLFVPSLLWLMVGLRKAESIRRSFKGLERKGIGVRFGEIEKIDPEVPCVTVAGETIPADYLIVALGADLAPEIVPGLQEAGHNFYDLGGAARFHEALGSMKRGRVVVLTAAPAYKCPAAPYEAALLIDAYFRKRGLREGITIEVYAAEAGPMGVAGPEMSGAVRRLLEGRGIPYHPEHQVKAVDAATRRLEFTNGAHADCDLLAFVPPHRAPRVVRESALASETGWISVDRHSLETRFPGVYAIGDVVSIPLALGKPLPKAGVFAHGEAEVVANNIAAIVAGKPPTGRFNGHGECFIEIGDGKAGFGGGDFYAEPKPLVTVHAPNRRFHLSKVLLEKVWLYTRL